MAIYFISATVDNVEYIYALDATETSSVNSSGQLSTHKLESGDYASDNYRNNPSTISLRGVISDVYVGNNISEDDRKTTKEYIEGLEKLKNDRIPFTVHYASDLTPKYPCFFNKLTYSQNKELGFSGSSGDGLSINAYKVSMQITETRIGRTSSITTGKASAFIDPTQDKQEASSPTKSEVTSRATSGYLDIYDSATNFTEVGTGTELPGG
jgi:hypothetical protein